MTILWPLHIINHLHLESSKEKLEIVDQWSTRIPRPIGEGGIVQNHKAAILKAT